MTLNDATYRQVLAADPTSSTWLSANAGSGKTRVVTDRVARLLIAGTNPESILCLTYTKAAANEMQIRLFKRLAEWIFLPDHDLRQQLTEMGAGHDLSDSTLSYARTLFARAVETPGGLKIQTIHSFCSGLLRRFPIEAGVSPNFVEMDEIERSELTETVLDELASSQDAGLLTSVMQYLSESQVRDVVKSIPSMTFLKSGGSNYGELAKLLELDPNSNYDSVVFELLNSFDYSMIDDVISLCSKGSKTEITLASKLSKIQKDNFVSRSAFDVLTDALLTQAGIRRARLLTKATIEHSPETNENLGELADQVEIALDQLKALKVVDATYAISKFAFAFSKHYDDRKSAEQKLDFDDLIFFAKKLIKNPDIADWILYKLDGGIHHILVDEAQDTSPEQWEIIRTLTEEFTLEQTDDEHAQRTLFVVGDKKQSIYSFQGADPAGFDGMSEHFSDKFDGYNRPFQKTELLHSFRSSPAILNVVDRVFNGEAARGLETDITHHAFFENLPGRVDIWPVVETSETPEQTPWDQPVDQVAANHQDVILSKQIAQNVHDMLANSTIPDFQNGEIGFRSIQPKDILILVRRRTSLLFPEIIRALKSYGLPVAGADRLRLTQSLAVKDILSVLKFLALPEDDLALAETLKSPLFSWDENRLFQLAYNRGKKVFLWQKMRTNPDLYQAELTVLNDLRKQVDYLRPFDLIQRLLLKHGGLEKLRARLGVEIDDAIEALLDQALAYEGKSVPDMTGFVEWILHSDLEVKRQIESESNLIRIMTVHGAKGLESPIVILPDTAKRGTPPSAPILSTSNTFLRRPKSDEHPTAFLPFVDAEAEGRENEDRRLLYVAMTRAEKWLIVAAAGKTGENLESWYSAISNGVSDLKLKNIDCPGGTARRFEVGQWETSVPTLQSNGSSPETLTLDLKAIPTKPKQIGVLNPSSMDSDPIQPKNRSANDRETALKIGTVMHKVLENCAGGSATAADMFLMASSLEGGLSHEILTQIANRAFSILNNPKFAEIFADSGLSEVDITAPLSSPAYGRLDGTIDRLIVHEKMITICDYKTNFDPPTTINDCPAAYIKQLGAYATTVSALYPHHAVSTKILWTESEYLMDIPVEMAVLAFKEFLNG